jgi:alpha-glucosidase/alpha-D-xyloside xylohydrolase
MTGLPVMRALWLHYPDDSKSAACPDEYLWGRNVLVAPVVEQGATSRKVYLPRGVWYDFWTRERLEGGCELMRPVDLETMPLYVRAGTIMPLGPLKQHVDEKPDEPLSILIYPGADDSFLLYEDDGRTFNYRKGEWMGTDLRWSDARRTLTLRLAPGSRMLPQLRRHIEVRLDAVVRNLDFDGTARELSF